MSTPRAPGERALNQDPNALRGRRIAAGLSKVALAEKAQISTTHMTQVELGQKSASPAVLVRLAKALGCDPEDLMARELIAK
ncbi:helix-turn-helix domain-containing protein [Nonomuraea sediminis]|uniref:helix-turn-helix domain-containing protein n=1 Tax=Nonomuraea sediminis TaxID=2835864 RepID=UPI001BDD7AF5|nr:helix-turn-helix transcriptional regulator [Nonomuraea sediminis]